MTAVLTTIIGDGVFGQPAGRLCAIHLRGGLIERVEPLAEVELPALVAAAGPGLLDARGLLVLPGLIDSHLHAIATGMQLLSGDLRHVSSVRELAEEVRTVAADGPDFVRLGGLDPSRLGADGVATITRQWLNDLTPERALYIKSVEGHSAWFNALAWERVGVNAVLERLKVPDARRREMQRAGRVWGNAYEHLTTPIYDSYSFAERKQGMELVIEQAKAVGLCGLHCLEGYGEHRRHDFELMLELDQRDDIDLTLYCRDETPALAAKLEVPRFGGCWCVDGAIAAHSAALAEPYFDKPELSGELYYSDQQLTAWIEAGLAEGMQVCLHAIGARALDQALRCFEQLAPRYDLGKLRPRLDHFVMGTPELARRAADLGVLSSMQPAFDARWGGAEGGYSQRLGPERALRSNPVGQMIESGLRIAGGSDSYITPLDPLGGIRAALNHHNEALRVDFETAVGLFSHDAAYLAHQEGTRGRIAAGYQADLTIVNGDRTLAEDAAVALTIKGGRVVYFATDELR